MTVPMPSEAFESSAFPPRIRECFSRPLDRFRKEFVGLLVTAREHYFAWIAWTLALGPKSISTDRTVEFIGTRRAWPCFDR